MSGMFYGVGVGPGDPDLLTIKAMRVIQAADVIIAPKTEKKEDSVALSIAQPYLKPDVEIVKLVFPMVFDGNSLSEAWEENRQVIAELLTAGKKVVFLTLGDPMFYSTYIYIFRLLKTVGYPIETIPGVPAFCAIGSRLGYPVVEGDEVLSIIPATVSEEKLRQTLAVSDNVVLMKVYKNAPVVIASLEQENMAEDAVLVSRCGLDHEQILYDIRQAKTKQLNYLSTILARRS